MVSSEFISTDELMPNAADMATTDHVSMHDSKECEVNSKDMMEGEIGTVNVPTTDQVSMHDSEGECEVNSKDMMEGEIGNVDVPTTDHVSMHDSVETGVNSKDMMEGEIGNVDVPIDHTYVKILAPLEWSSWGGLSATS
jgi:hypothetical protein